jgi:Kef-type K+ transport system membrane component KefB
MHSLFSEISVLVALVAVVALVMRLLKQPLIIGHILTGIIVGPAALGLVRSAETIEVFAKIGISLLLFIIGLGLNPRVIKEVGKPALIVGLAQMTGTTLIGILSSKFLGLSLTESVIFGLAISFSSTIIILKLLSDKHEQTRLYGKISIGILLLQDILAAILLLVVTAQGNNKGFDIVQLLYLIAKGLAVAVPLLLIGSHILPRMQKLVAGSQEFLFLFAIGWGFGAAALFESVGFSLEIGSLIAGIALSGLVYSQEISARLRPLRDFFVVVFFVNLGVHLNFGNITQILPIVIVGVVLVSIVKPLVVLMSMGMIGYTKQTSFRVAVCQSQISEFSLVMVGIALSKSLVSSNFVDAVVLIGLITIAVSTYLIGFSDGIFKLASKHLHMFERGTTRSERTAKTNYDVLIFGLNKGGHEFVRLFNNMNKRFAVVDYDPEVIEKLENAHLPYIYGDVTDPELLSEVDLTKVRLIVSTMTDFETNKFLVMQMEKDCPGTVMITTADSANHANVLYELGASYVMMPHLVGSEKMGNFIKHSGFKKTEFKKFREKHVAHINSGFYADL